MKSFSGKRIAKITLISVGGWFSGASLPFWAGASRWHFLGLIPWRADSRVKPNIAHVLLKTF